MNLDEIKNMNRSELIERIIQENERNNKKADKRSLLMKTVSDCDLLTLERKACETNAEASERAKQAVSEWLETIKAIDEISRARLEEAQKRSERIIADASEKAQKLLSDAADKNKKASDEVEKSLKAFISAAKTAYQDGEDDVTDFSAEKRNRED